VSRALVMITKQSKPEAWQLTSRWLSASDTTGAGDLIMHPEGVPGERWSITADRAAPPLAPFLLFLWTGGEAKSLPPSQSRASFLGLLVTLETQRAPHALR
ncbi:MAG TPA: hypothetical protein VFJ27_03060, partial [Terriglobia bacterium]|nr:hypothetical protein [Terriglobia bacterium]